MLEDEEPASGSFQMVPPGTNNTIVTPRRTLKELASAAIHSFDKHPQSSDPNAELTLALDKTLKAYHSQLIALGSAIGTGLFIASGAGLAIAGPIPMLTAFSFVGFTLCPTVFALGEMATFLPYPGGFVIHSKIFIDDAWGAAVGWNYALQWLVTLPLELIAASMTLQYWGSPLHHHWVWVTLFLIGIAFINISGVKGYANVEAGLSIMKVVAIIGFIIVAMLIDVGLGFDGKAVGVEKWYDPGATRHGWVGFTSVLVIAAFAYSGSEMVGLTASEQEMPRRDMPKAIAKVFWRIGIFYILSIFLIGLLVPYNDSLLIENPLGLTSSQSPFVIALKRAGIRVLPGIMNSVILITVLSVANSSVYGSSRVLNAMADAGLAPKAFAYIDRMGRPLRCFYLALAFGLLAYLAQLPDHDTAFLWLLALSGLSSIFNWLSICITHLRFRKALEIAEIDVADLPFRSPTGIIGTWVGIFCNSFLIVIQFLSAIFPVDYETKSTSLRARSFFSSFMAFPIIIIFFVLFKYFAGTRIEGVEWRWESGEEGRRGLVFDEGGMRVVWGEGTSVVDLRDIDFRDDMWTLEHYYVWARAHPQMVGMRELWFVPESWRDPIKERFYFPWR